MTNQLSLRFVGNNISPISVRARELAEIISSFESAVVGIVLLEHQSLKAENIAVSLVDIQNASLGLGFDSDVNELVYPAGLQLANAIEERHWGELPIKTLKDLRKLVGYTKRWSCQAEMRTVYGNTTALTILSPEVDIPATATLYGGTEVVGVIKRVGGAEPRVMLTTLQGETLYCDLEEEMAKKLAQYLYETVQLAGYARWNFETLEILEFEITEIVAHIDRKPKAGFSKIRQRYGTYFDDIEDVEDWTTRIRYGG